MSVRILHLSDIHFGYEDASAVAASAAFAASAPFDLLVVSGDLTQEGREPQFRSAAAWLSALPGPRLVTPGNHDTPWMGLIERVRRPFAGYARAIGPPWLASFVSPRLTAVAVNSARGWQLRLNWSKGEISRGQAEAASRRLEGAPPNALRVLVCHHPLLEVPDAPMTARVRGGAFAAARFARAGVDLILSGHLHAPFVQPLPFADKRTYAVGAGTLSRRERGAPASFNVIELDGERMTVSVIAWAGGRLDAGSVWAVPLRARASNGDPADGH